jgi:hypothetical protein
VIHLKRAQIYTTAAVLAFLVFASLSAFAFAPGGEEKDGTNKDMIYPDIWEGRSFSYERQSDGAYLSSMMTEENVTDSVYLSVSTHDGLQLYYSASTGDWEQGASMNIGLDVLGLLEFKDTDGDGKFDPLVDEVISTLPLSSRFQYLDFVKEEEPEPPEDPKEPVEEWDRGYKDGYEKGYEVGYRVGVEHAESGMEYNPDPWEHFPELKDLFNWSDPDEGWDDYPDWEDDEGIFIPFFDIIENDDGTITLVIIDENGNEEQLTFSSFEEFEEWLMKQFPEEPPKDPEYPPEDPEYPPEIPELDPYYEGYLFGLMDGFFQGYMEGYGLDDDIFYPCYEEEGTIREDYGVTDIWCPEPWPEYRDHFLPLEANTERYGSEGYDLSYSVSDIGGYVSFNIFASGPLAGEFAFKPALGLEMTVDYPFTSNDTQAAIIMDTSFSSFTYTGGICYILDDDVFEPYANAEEVENTDVETPKIPWMAFDEDGNELSTIVSRYYRQYGEWEDLYTSGVYSYEGLIISLPSSINDHVEPEIPEDPKEDPKNPEDPKEDPELPEEDPDDEKYVPFGRVDPDKETDQEEKDDTLPSGNIDASNKGASSDGLSFDTYTILIAILIGVLVCLVLATGFIAYRKFK